MIDAITGNPLEVFKLQNKQLIEYNLRRDKKVEQEFTGTFDSSRMALLIQLLGGTRKCLVEVFLEWYHQFRYFNGARDTISKHFLTSFKITAEFLDIVRCR
jgi:hypothetical protein